MPKMDGLIGGLKRSPTRDRSLGIVFESGQVQLGRPTHLRSWSRAYIVTKMVFCRSSPYLVRHDCDGAFCMALSVVAAVAKPRNESRGD